MALHSNISASSSERWMNCPGSVRLCAELPPSPTSKDMAEGTVAHSLVESLVKRQLDTENIWKREGETVMEGGYEIEITDEMIEAATQNFNVVEEDAEKLDRPAPIVIKSECRVIVSSVDQHAYGTCDTALYQKANKLGVYDFKYGRGVVVEVKDNSQLLIYLAGAMDTFAGDVFEELELVIVQPRAMHKDGIVRRWTTTVAAVKAFKEKLRKAIAETRKAESALVSGKWCRWCPAKADCSALYSTVQAETVKDFAVVPSAATPSLPSPAQLTPVKVAEALMWKETITSFFDGLEARAKELLEGGIEVPGFKLVDGISRRQWISEDAVREHYGAVLGEEKLYNKKLRSPADMEKVVGKGKIPPELIVKPVVGKTLAKDSSPRPAAKASVEQDFAPIPKQLEGSEEVKTKNEKSDKSADIFADL